MYLKEQSKSAYYIVKISKGKQSINFLLLRLLSGLFLLRLFDLW